MAIGSFVIVLSVNLKISNFNSIIFGPMKSKIATLFLLPLLLTTVGCHLFESTTVPASEIKKASTWSAEDQHPSFPECEELSGTDLVDCFQQVIREAIVEALPAEAFVATEPLEEEVTLTLMVDKNGSFSLETFEASRSLKNALPELESQFQMVIENLPQAQPAMKTNVGVAVQVSFELPLKISAQPEEEEVF